MLKPPLCGYRTTGSDGLSCCRTVTAKVLLLGFGGHRETSKGLKKQCERKQEGREHQVHRRTYGHLRAPDTCAHPKVGVRNWTRDASNEPGPSSGAKVIPNKSTPRPPAKAKTNPPEKNGIQTRPLAKAKTNPLEKQDSSRVNLHPMKSDLKIISQNIQEKKPSWEMAEITNSFRQPKTYFR